MADRSRTKYRRAKQFQRIIFVPGESVVTLDSTGAGDAFVGSLAYFLAGGKQVTDAMRRANQIAAISVQSSGTQTSFPKAADLPKRLMDLGSGKET